MRSLKIGIPIALGLISLALLSWLAAPPGMRWLGEGIQNPSDVAVYISYLRQGAEGHALLSGLFSVEPTRARFDGVWSLLGGVAWIGIPPLVVHEAARAIFVLLLAWALFAAATSCWREHRDATLATMLAFGGFGTGWLYSIYLGATNRWSPSLYPAPDVISELAIGPVLLGGAHVILSVALLVTSIRLIWMGILHARRRTLLVGAICGAALLSFHPYFTPLLLLIALLATTQTTSSRIRRVSDLSLLAAAFAPSAAYYAWLLTDPVFGTHHLQVNFLPLAPPHVWLITLLPFIAAGIWMARRRLFPKRLDWMSAWVLCATVLAVFLPVPWHRKLTEGLTIPLVFLTMPAWFAIRDWISKREPRWMRKFLFGMFILAAWLGPLHLVASDLAWRGRADKTNYFYQPTALFRIAEAIRTTTPTDAILLSDHRWTNLWLPALTGRRVWVGHDHETPNFQEKKTLFNELIITTSTARAKAILDKTGATLFITTQPEQRERFSILLAPEWHVTMEDAPITVWQR